MAPLHNLWAIPWIGITLAVALGWTLSAVALPALAGAFLWLLDLLALPLTAAAAKPSFAGQIPIA